VTSEALHWPTSMVMVLMTDDIILGVYSAENEVILNNGDRSFQKVPLPGGRLGTFSILAGMRMDGLIL